MKTILYITKAKHIKDYQVWLQFNNGQKGIVDLSETLWGGMFESLKDKSLFAQVKIDKEMETIVWPNGADLAPEFLYDLLKPTKE